MDFKKEYKKLVETVKNNSGINQDVMAKRLRYSRTYLSELTGRRGKVEEYHIQDFKKEFFKELENTTNDLKEVVPYDVIMRLANSNEILARAHEELAQANNKLASNAIDLTSMLKEKQPAGGPQEINEDVEAKFQRLLGAVAEVLTAKDSYLSKHEAFVALSKFFYAEEKTASKKGTQTDGHTDGKKIR